MDNISNADLKELLINNNNLINKLISMIEINNSKIDKIHYLISKDKEPLSQMESFGINVAANIVGKLIK